MGPVDSAFLSLISAIAQTPMANRPTTTARNATSTEARDMGAIAFMESKRWSVPIVWENFPVREG